MISFGGFMTMAWMPFLIVVWIVAIALVVWFIIRWFNRRQTPSYPSVPPQQTKGTYQEGGILHSHPQPENDPLGEQLHMRYPQQERLPVQ